MVDPAVPSFKVVVCGDSGVGKTTLLRSLAERPRANSPYQATIGVDFVNFMHLLPGTNRFVRLQLWDLAGQERFAAVTPATFRSAAAVVFAFDITNADSYAARSRWLPQAPAEARIVLAGTKADLADKRAVSAADASDECNAHGWSYFETSAMEQRNVRELFAAIAEALGADSAAQPAPRVTPLILPPSRSIDVEPRPGCAC